MSTPDWKLPQQYEIRFKGHVSSFRAQIFEGFEIVQGSQGETVLTGPLQDQSALHGILNRIRDMGVPLLSVRRLNYSEIRMKKESEDNDDLKN